MRTTLLLLFLLLFTQNTWAQKKTEPKIIRVGAPLPDSAKKTGKIPEVEKVGNYTLIRIPDDKVPENIKPKHKAVDTPKLVRRFTSAGTAPNVQVNIRLMDSRVRKLSDVIVYITLTNKSRHHQQILFDKPYRAGFGPWYTECFVRRNGANVATQTSRLKLDETYPPEYLSLHKIEVKASQWVMKGYALNSLAGFSSQVEQAQKLPSGSYELQIYYMGLPSNVVTFTML